MEVEGFVTRRHMRSCAAPTERLKMRWKEDAVDCKALGGGLRA